MKEILNFDNISLNYHSKTDEIAAVRDLSFQVYDGEFISIIGPSGCGKTTILSMISGILPPTNGTISIDGKKISGPSKEIGYMLQKDQLFPWRSIYQNAIIGLEIQHTKTPQALAVADDLLKKYGLWDFRNKYPNELSGGMKQRVALIRTLVLNPKILLLDEPFSALDYQTRLNVTNDVYNIIKSEKKTAILITHDISESISMSDRILVLTKRPARLCAVHECKFDGILPTKRRENAAFPKTFDKIWSEISHEDEQA